jgi:hypothetical protein
MKYYAGIGSRKTPANFLEKFEKIGAFLAKKGYVLRSGGANGADSAFERGCDSVSGEKEIYLPWKGFNGNESPFHNVSDNAIKMAEKFHPAWHKVSNAGKLLHARNCYQILGNDLRTPSSFVVCWTPKTGGTQQAIRVAKAHNVLVLNFFSRKNYNGALEYYIAEKHDKLSIESLFKEYTI